LSTSLPLRSSSRSRLSCALSTSFAVRASCNVLPAVRGSGSAAGGAGRGSEAGGGATGRAKAAVLRVGSLLSASRALTFSTSQAPSASGALRLLQRRMGDAEATRHLALRGHAAWLLGGDHDSMKTLDDGCCADAWRCVTLVYVTCSAATAATACAMAVAL
jgi:hypothetical protein